jgi:hypothetical protein
MKLTIEQIQSLYFDENALKLPSYQMYRLNTPKGRYYYTYDENDNLKFYISVTNIIGRFTPTPHYLIDWIAQQGKEGAEQIKNRRAAYGTLMHQVIDELIINNGIDIEKLPETVDQYFETEKTYGANRDEFLEELKKDVLAFAQFMIDKEVTPIAVEPILKSDQFGTAGAIDLFCKMKFNNKEVYAIIDFKSGKKAFYESNEIQLEYYKHALLEEWPEFGDQNIMLFNWSGKDWRKKPEYNLKNQTDKHSFEELKLYSDLYKIKTSSNPIENTQVIEFTGEIDLSAKTIENNYKVLNINEKISNHDTSEKQNETDEQSTAESRENQDRGETPKQSGQRIPNQPGLF